MNRKEQTNESLSSPQYETLPSLSYVNHLKIEVILLFAQHLIPHPLLRFPPPVRALTVRNTLLPPQMHPDAVSPNDEWPVGISCQQFPLPNKYSLHKYPLSLLSARYALLLPAKFVLS